MIVAALLALATAQAPAPDPVLRISSAVAPETVTVGEPFRSVLRVHVPPGSRVEFTGLAVGDSVQPVDTVAAIRGGSGDGATALYRAVAWVAGVPVRASVRVRVTDPGGTQRDYRVPLRMPAVRSVLPADGSDLRPRPPHPPFPLPAREPVWPWIVAGSLALLAAVLLWLRMRRTPAMVAREEPRAAALRALDGLAGAEPRRTVDRATRILRRYLEAVEPTWTEAWTESELIERIEPGEMPALDRGALAALLDDAVRMRFAGGAVSGSESHRYVARVRGWIAAWPASAPAGEREAA